MDIEDRLTKRARLLFWLNGLGFFAWQAGDGLAMAGFTGRAATGSALIASGIGFGVWLVSLILVLGLGWQARRAGLYDILGDEWAKHARARAAEAAFWIVTISIVVCMTLSNFGFDAQLALKLLTGLAVASFLIAYAIFDAQHDRVGDAA